MRIDHLAAVPEVSCSKSCWRNVLKTLSSSSKLCSTIKMFKSYSELSSFHIWKNNNLHSKIPRWVKMNNSNRTQFSIAGFKFIFISLNRTQVTIRIQYFFPQTCFFLFFFYYAKQENTQCNKTEDSDSAVLSLPFHSARLYTQKDCTSSLLHFQPPPTNIMDRVK